MDDTGLREFAYFCKLPADELSDHICSLPYTLVELIIDTAINNEDFMMDILTETINTLKENTHKCSAKRALRKLLSVCKTLEVENYFEFGDPELLNGGVSATASIEPPIIIKNLIDAGQLEREPVNGKYRLYKKSMREFIFWCFSNGYEDISPLFVINNILYRGNSVRSIESYISQAKSEEK